MRMLLYEALQFFVHFFTILYYVKGEISTKNEKRANFRNKYQTCFDSFNVHQDKIIRTQESLDMGAKYLKEIDVDSRDECLKFCCDTEYCDVFIFEEKKPGNCYLFQCGPLHDFKCKFTNHANYSSAVRTNYDTQHSAQIEEEIRISQQEHELKSLRKLGEIPAVKYSFTKAPIKLIATLAPKLSVTTLLPIKPVCSRNQYECRSSGECIAVYNVCDGIPQCADGSDEASDLVCPTEKPTIFPSIIQGPQPPLPPLPVDIIKYQQMIDQHKSLPALYPHVQEVNSWELPNLAHQMIPQQPVLYPAQQMEMPQVHKSVGAPGYQWNYQPIYGQNKDPYNSVNSLRDQSNLNSYEQDQPHIFNHKGSSVIGEKETDSGTYLDVRQPYISHFGSTNRGSWQNTQIFPSPSLIPNSQQKQIDEVENSIASTTPPCDISSEQKSILKNKEMEKMNEEGKEMNQEKQIVHEKKIIQNSVKQNALKSGTPKFNHVKGKEATEHNSVIVIKDHSRDHGRSTLIADHLKQVNDIEALKPKGAVISLALGLTITAITATLIACRLRVVRRRGRRHGGYAHDADYLVNGMYL